MKKLINLILIVAFASHFGTIETFAQKRAKPKEVIIVVFSIPNDQTFDGLEFPINRTAKGKLDDGGGMVSECGIPEDPECAKSIYSAYDIYGRAFAVGKNQAKIKLKGELTVDDKDCQINGTYTVYRNRKTNIRFNSCGANLIVFYGFESEETN